MTNRFHFCERCGECVQAVVEGLCRPCEEERREDEVERAFDDDDCDDGW